MPRAIYSPGGGTRLLQRGTVVQNPAGDLTVDLFDHLRETKRRLGPTVEKVEGPDFIVYRTRRR